MLHDKKMAMFYILDILKEYSDENHLITQQDIIDKLHNIYGIDIWRKTISTTIRLLDEYNFEIKHTPKQGYYLVERKFDENEIKYLVDAIYSSKTIPGNIAKELSKKLYSELSRYKQKEYHYLYKSIEINRNKNLEFFLNIEIINEAIQEGKKITFEYMSYDENGKLIKRRNGFKYKVSPYFLINNFNKYYLLCNIDRFDNHANFRVEYMCNVKKIDDKIKPYKNVTTMGPNFNISKHINDHVYMFGGKLINASIELLNKNAITYVLDWFGNNARVYKNDDKLLASIKTDEDAFYYWALQYQDNIKILSPENIILKVRESLERNLKKYDL